MGRKWLKPLPNLSYSFPLFLVIVEWLYGYFLMNFLQNVDFCSASRGRSPVLCQLTNQLSITLTDQLQVPASARGCGEARQVPWPRPRPARQVARGPEGGGGRAPAIQQRAGNSQSESSITLAIQSEPSITLTDQSEPSITLTDQSKASNKLTDNWPITGPCPVSEPVWDQCWGQGWIFCRKIGGKNGGLNTYCQEYFLPINIPFLCKIFNPVEDFYSTLDQIELNLKCAAETTGQVTANQNRVLC